MPPSPRQMQNPTPQFSLGAPKKVPESTCAKLYEVVTEQAVKGKGFSRQETETWLRSQLSTQAPRQLRSSNQDNKISKRTLLRAIKESGVEVANTMRASLACSSFNNTTTCTGEDGRQCKHERPPRGLRRRPQLSFPSCSLGLQLRARHGKCGVASKHVQLGRVRCGPEQKDN